MGYSKMITEGAKHVLGWKSPNYVYQAATQPKLKLLLKNSRFSDDITYRFSNYSWNEYPLTAEKFISWINATPPEEEVINLFMNYETLGNLQPSYTGIFEFFKAMPRLPLKMESDLPLRQMHWRITSPLVSSMCPTPSHGRMRSAI